MASIGFVAKMAGISVETLRYYEKQGLIDTTARKDNGYRDYPEALGYRAFALL